MTRSVANEELRSYSAFDRRASAAAILPELRSKIGKGNDALATRAPRVMSGTDFASSSSTTASRRAISSLHLATSGLLSSSPKTASIERTRVVREKFPETLAKSGRDCPHILASRRFVGSSRARSDSSLTRVLATMGRVR